VFDFSLLHWYVRHFSLEFTDISLIGYLFPGCEIAMKNALSQTKSTIVLHSGNLYRSGFDRATWNTSDNVRRGLRKGRHNYYRYKTVRHFSFEFTDISSINLESLILGYIGQCGVTF
jgi:hypothetical protein